MVTAEQVAVVTIPASTSAMQGYLSLQSNLESGLRPEASPVKADSSDSRNAGNANKEHLLDQVQTGDNEAGHVHITSLFAALPTYGPPTTARKLQYMFFKVTSSILSLLFLLSIVVASMITSIPGVFHKAFYACTFRNYDKRRVFYEEEQRRADARRARERSWKRRMSCGDGPVDQEGLAQRYQPTEAAAIPSSAT
ncbi:hypothetical protein NLG97_g10508 [Lecanicillium saksenae]|uniref:Uncharacterized protein n=1 Tax=Lecanicillium saksenae TaxID=468837 RepID=A0ACC1QFQ6_9HYPO|nr:hypothetical protein NLG97_g10508 [Lecanicillium saksenae]